MFKNAIVAKLSGTWSPNIDSLEEALQEQRFVPCPPTALQSLGWIEPRGLDHGALVESVQGHWIVRLCVEKKILPGSVVKRAVNERVAELESQSGIRPGKRQIRDLKEEVMMDLLPKALTKIETIDAWLDTRQGFVVVNAGSMGKVDLITSMLVKAIDGLSIRPLSTAQSAATIMTNWLMAGECDGDFDLDRECEIKSTEEDKAVVRYVRHSLDIDEIKQHLINGKVPTKLALTWRNRVGFILSDALQLKKIQLMDDVMPEGGDDEDSFDADVAIFTGEMSALIQDLIDVLGGELINENL